MKNEFQAQVMGISPERTRASLANGEPAKRDKSLVEQHQPFPELKPLGMCESSVDRQSYHARLNQEQQRVARYQMRVTEIHSRIFINGELVESKVDRDVTPINRTHHTTHEFNMHSSYEHDRKELGLSY